MSVFYRFAMYVDHRTFIPTKAQLLGIAAILEEAGVIDAAGRGDLEQEITGKYPDDDALVDVFGEEDSVVLDDDPRDPWDPSYCFLYKLAGPGSFPFFGDFSEQATSQFSESGRYDAQTLLIYKNIRTIGEPFQDHRYTRFIIAGIDEPRESRNIDELEEAEQKMEQDPVLLLLRSHIGELLGIPIVVETYVS